MTLNKLIRKFIFSPLLWGSWVGLLLLLFSCSKEDFGENAQRNPEEERISIRFEIALDPQTRVATDADFNTTWQPDDQIGIYIVKGNGGLQPSGNYVDNMKLELTNAGWISHFPLPNLQYYPNDGENLNFYAYYPYNPDLGAEDITNYLFSVQADQSAKEDHNESDLLLAKAEDFNKNRGVVPLEFTHAFALIQIEVKKENTVPDLDGDFKVTLINVQRNALLNWNSSMQGANSFDDIIMHKVDGMEYTYRALLPAQTLPPAAGVVFKQTTSGKIIDKEYDLESAVLTSGKVHKYKLTLK